MDFRFAGFISISLFAHLVVLLTGAEQLSHKIGGEAATMLSVTLLSNPRPVPPSPPLHEAPVQAPAAPVTIATTVLLPASAHAKLSAAAPLKPDFIAPAQRAEPASVSAASAHAARPVSKQISAALQNQFSEQFAYPWLARKRGWQGRVMLSLHIEKNGDLSRWKVARTSGHKVLDRSALDSAKRIHSLPEAAALLNGTALDLLVPVHYRLLDS